MRTLTCILAMSLSTAAYAQMDYDNGYERGYSDPTASDYTHDSEYNTGVREGQADSLDAAMTLQQNQQQQNDEYEQMLREQSQRTFGR